MRRFLGAPDPTDRNTLHHLGHAFGSTGHLHIKQCRGDHVDRGSGGRQFGCQHTRERHHPALGSGIGGDMLVHTGFAGHGAKGNDATGTAMRGLGNGSQTSPGFQTALHRAQQLLLQNPPVFRWRNVQRSLRFHWRRDVHHHLQTTQTLFTGIKKMADRSRVYRIDVQLDHPR